MTDNRRGIAQSEHLAARSAALPPPRMTGSRMTGSRKTALSTALRAALCGLAIGALPTPATAQAQPAAAALPPGGEVKVFSVPAGPLDAALGQFARASGVDFSYDPDAIAGLETRGLSGNYSVASGLQKLLRGTGIAAVRQPGGGYTLRRDAAPSRPAGAAAATTLPSLRVMGSELDGYQPTLAASPKFTSQLRDIPKSVTVVPKQVIEDTGSTSLQDVLRTTAGITFAAGEGGVPLADRPVIRGFNSTSNMLVDGMRDIGAQSREVFNLEQIEVTKGPDSAYYGRGGGGGSINLVIKSPQQRNFVTGEFTAGTAPGARAVVDGNWQLSDHAAFRLNVLGDTGHVAGRDEAVDYHKFGIAPSLSLGLGTATRLNLNYYHLDDRGMPDYGIPLNPNTGAPTHGAPHKAFYGLEDRDFRETTTDIGTLTIEHDLSSNLVLRNMTRSGRSTNSYVATAPNGASPVFAEVNQAGTLQGTVFRQAKSQWTRTDTLANQTDVYGEFTTGFLKHNIDTGVEFSREKWNVDGWTVSSANASAALQSGSVPQCQAYPSLYGSGDCTSLYSPDPDDNWIGTVRRNHNPTYYKTDTRSAYLFDSITLSEHWLVNTGVRWDGYRTRSSRGGVELARQRDDFLNYQLGLVYKPVSYGSFYASVASASTPAALGSSDYDKVSAANRDLKPERSVAYELGTKWDVLDERLSLTAALFETRRKNATVAVDATTVESVGESRVKGFELGAEGNVTAAWKIFAGYTYLESEIVRGAYNDDNVGKPLPDTPRNSLSVWSTYQLQPAWSVGGGAYYVDDRFGTACDRDCYAPEYWRVDAFGEWKASDHLKFRLNLQNLFDRRYYTKVHYFMGVPGPGRSAAVTAIVSY